MTYLQLRAAKQSMHIYACLESLCVRLIRMCVQ